jgi:methionyl-tRNA formyltransferase
MDTRGSVVSAMIRSIIAPITAAPKGSIVMTSLVVTLIGPDRPGIVSMVSERARGYGANWAGSRMASLAGQFAGMVHFQVASENAEALANALRSLQSSGLSVVIVRSDAAPAPIRGRAMRLELVGHDRPGIVRDLSASLAERGVSIQDLRTEIVSAAMSAENLFKVKALLIVPNTLPDDDLRRGLESLANEMMVDLALGESAAD